jgi:hypothetical protein
LAAKPYCRRLTTGLNGAASYGRGSVAAYVCRCELKGSCRTADARGLSMFGISI